MSGNTRRRWHYAVAGFASLLAGLAAPGPASASTVDRSAELAGTVVESENITLGPDGQTVRTPGNARAVPGQVPAGAAPKTDGDAPPPVKISPRLAARMADAARADRLADRTPVIITYAEDQQIPLFPSLDPSESFAAPANAAVRASADALVRDLTARREAGYRAARAQIEQLGGTVRETFWLSRSVSAEIPLSAVPALAARSDVRSIEPTDGTRPPSGNTEADARALLGTDPYFTTPRPGDRVAIIDTGVEALHPLLDGRIDLHQDFTGEGDALTDGCFHGTATAAAISGGTRSGNEYRGITSLLIDVYKVYPNFGPKPCVSDSTFVVKALQAAVQNLEKVIVVEVEGKDTENGAMAMAADSAFDSGAVVVSAAGNFGPGPKTVTSPGNARKVLGIGAVDVVSFARLPIQGEGPTGDNRIKPDLVAPTNVETANSVSGFDIFTGTSAATAQAGGTAATLRQFIRGSRSTIDPGLVHAGMIMGGSRSNGGFDDIEGAGKLRLSPPPPNGTFTWMTTKSPAGSTVGVSLRFDVASTNCRLSAAVWWPESPGLHNDIDVEIVDPNGVRRAISQTGRSVFELARVDGPLTPGQWTVHVYPFRPLVTAQNTYTTISTCR